MTVLTDRVGVVTDGADADARSAKGSETLTYEQARDKLAAVCEEWLDGARARLAAAMAKRDEGEAAAAEDDAPF